MIKGGGHWYVLLFVFSRDLSVKGRTSERCYRTRRGRTDEQRYTIISPYFDGRIKMNGPYPEITNISFLAKLFFKSFHMVYTINWFKKCNILITVLTLGNWPLIVTNRTNLSSEETEKQVPMLTHPRVPSRTVGLSDRRTIGLSDWLSNCRTIGLSDYSYGPLLKQWQQQQWNWKITGT
jgi:hypothetical protein